jgi:hypothetical protein
MAGRGHHGDRPRLHPTPKRGLIARVEGTHRYRATTEGLQVAFFFSKLYLRILRPCWPTSDPHSVALPRPLRRALAALDRVIATLQQEAALAA